MGCLKLTYRQEPDFRVIYSKKELTLKNSSQKVYRSYLYGFQGQEKDDELKGAGNSVNYEFRMYDSRLGRFFNLDPLANEYPDQSNYSFVENSPVMFLEIDGRFYDFSGLDERNRVYAQQMYEQRLRKKKGKGFRRRDVTSIKTKINNDQQLVFENENRAKLYFITHKQSKDSKDVFKGIVSENRELSIASQDNLDDFTKEDEIRKAGFKKVRVNLPEKPNGEEVGIYSESVPESTSKEVTVYRIAAEIDLDNNRITVNRDLLNGMGRHEKREFMKIVKQSEKMLKKFGAEGLPQTDSPSKDSYNFRIRRGNESKVVSK